MLWYRLAASGSSPDNQKESTMLNRYYVERVSEPEHKGWLVMDRKTLRMVQFCPTRRAARQAASEGNAEEESQS